MVLKQACGSNGFHFSLHLGCVCAATADPVPVMVMVFSLPPWEIYILNVQENQHIFAPFLGGMIMPNHGKRVWIFGLIFCSPVMEVLPHEHVLNKGCTGILKERQFINVNPICTSFICIYLFNVKSPCPYLNHGMPFPFEAISWHQRQRLRICQILHSPSFLRVFQMQI